MEYQIKYGVSIQLTSRIHGHWRIIGNEKTIFEFKAVVNLIYTTRF